MNILIKGMNAPRCCRECDWFFTPIIEPEAYCQLTRKAVKHPIYLEGRPSECPIVEIPTDVVIEDCKYRKDIYGISTCGERGILCSILIDDGRCRKIRESGENNGERGKDEKEVD